MQILKKEWIWKKKGVVEKRGEEETKSMPHAPVLQKGKQLLPFIKTPVQVQ